MFTKNKVSQSMIDAVKNVINESGSPIKEPTATGVRVYGRSYGNSAKAKQDQTSHELDKVKGPKDKEMKEAISDKSVKEELKGNQDKIDANHNDKIDAQDFKILKAKKKVTEDMHFAKKLLEAEKAKQSPAKNQDIADKSYLKDKPGVKSDLKNLGRFLTGKKETNEEVELTEEQLDEMINEVLGKDATAGDYIHDFVHSDNPKFAGKSKAERKKMALGAYYGKQNEAKEDGSPITTDTLAGRMPGGKSNDFKSFKVRVRPLDKEGEHTPKDATPKAIQPDDTPARKSHETKQKLKTEGKRPETDDAPPFDEPYTRTAGEVKDKSGAVHTPMSRARDLARAAMKKVKTEMLGKTGTSEGKKW